MRRAAVRKRNQIAAILAAGAMASVACTGVGPLGPNGIELRVTTANSVLAAIGSQTQLELELPDGMSTTGLETVWRSSAPSIASVDGNGMVTAVGHGVATITADAGMLSASTTITVDANIVSVARVQSDQTDLNPANDTASVTITIQAN
jgi:hypothetical protein